MHGSSVTSIGQMDELVELLVRRDLHPGRTVTARFASGEAVAAYVAADAGTGGKVGIEIGR